METRTQPGEIELEVFRAGDYGPKGAYAEPDLDALVADYRSDRHEAPVTFDHAQAGPAHGWVKALRRAGDRLVALLARPSALLRVALATGAYRKRSIELFRNHPETGRPYLKAVSFLGAAAPEVSGLADPEFSAAGRDVVCFDAQDAAVVAAPDVEAAGAARARLMAAGRWHPEWGTEGPVIEWMAELAALGRLEHFERCLAAMPPLVTFGAVPIGGSPLRERYADNLVGGASPHSIERHRRAMRALEADPRLSYGEALLRAGADA